MSGVLGIVLAVALGIALAWAALVAALVLGRPRGGLLREAVRLLPDTLRLLEALVSDPTLPRGVRTRLWLLFAYLATPIDQIPDFLPVIGYVDDAILVAMVLRSVVRRAGIDAVRRHWPGTDDGFGALCRIAGVPTGAGG